MYRLSIALSACLLAGVLPSCQSQQDPYDQYLQRYTMEYHQRPGYFEQLEAVEMPEHLDFRSKLLLVAYGFDPNVRLTLAARLVDQYSLEVLNKNLEMYVDSKEPELAWAVAWIGDKFPEVGVSGNYQRPDIIEWEEEYHQ